MNKALFVKNLGLFLAENVPSYDIKGLVYVEDDDGREWVYVNWKSYAQSRINVSGDSQQGILEDVVNNILKRQDWVVPMDMDIYNQ